jgi:DNA-binding PadR family transcriptional regulator
MGEPGRRRRQRPDAEKGQLDAGGGNWLNPRGTEPPGRIHRSGDACHYIVDSYIAPGYISPRMKTGTPEPKASPALSPAVFHILLSLADGEKHGYAIMQEVANTTDGQLRMGPGTLYGAIKRMLAAGLIEESDERPDQEMDDERRRYYRLTGVGRQQVGDEAQKLARLVGVAKRRGLVRPLSPRTA